MSKIEVINVSKQLKEKCVLNDINVTFESGKMYLLKGHNGCGKTMLLRLLCGLIAPTKGEVRGLDSCSFGVMIENPSFLLGETAYYNLDYLASIRKVIGKSEIEDMLKQVGLYHVKDKKVKSFSLGMKQRLGIAQALMENPDVILLDEPFNALDDENFQIVFDLLKEEKAKGKTVVVAAHSLESTVLQEFDEVVVMNDGKISDI